MRLADFEPETVLKGMRAERERVADSRVAIEIALARLAQDPSYYDEPRRSSQVEIEPEDAGENEGEVVEPEVKLAKPRPRVFVEGDEFYAEVGQIADALFARGSDRLGYEALEWLSQATASRKQLNPYRARR